LQFLSENQNIPIHLEQFIKENKKLHQYFDINFSGVQPKNYCGFLSIDSKNYFIVPKITDSDNQNLNIFIYMLLYAYDIKLQNLDLINSTNTKFRIIELFIKFFADTLLNEFKKGVFKQYISLQENLKTLRGKYLIKNNFNNFHNQNIYCEFDEFSMDNELNRFFLFAINIFKRYSSYSNLYRCEAVLDEVALINVNLKKLNINFDRINSRFKHSFNLALMILQKLVPLVEKGADRSFAFLFDMAEVFEKFVGRIYQEIDSSAILQKQANFGSLVLKPDILTDSKIIDTKYKKLNRQEDLLAQDKYQMFVYGTNFKVKDTMLLYPKHLLDIDENLELGKGDDMIRLKLKSLDLSFDGGFEEFVEEIKRRLKNEKN